MGRIICAIPDLLAKLAVEAMTEYLADKTQELDPETRYEALLS